MSELIRRPRFTIVLALLAATAAWWIFGAWMLPVFQDEAYYFLWAQGLSLGYFDHPPLVALMAYPSTLFPTDPFLGRLGTWLTALLVFVSAALLFRRVGLRSPRALFVALLLAHFNLLGLIFGFLTTPDTVLLLGWVLALHEGLVALEGHRRRWLSAGLATGFGILAKYTMVLIGPVFLWGLWRQDPKALKTPWPYAGGVVALLVLVPHLYWNAQNDWITFDFQFRHGFSLDRPQITGTDLPSPLPRQKGTPEAELGARFAPLEKATETEERSPRIYDPVLDALNRYLGFYASQLALWGVLMWPLGREGWRAWKRRRLQRDGGSAPGAGASRPFEGESIQEGMQPVLRAGMWVPLLVFGGISLFLKAEANWAAMYVISAAALATPLLVRRARTVAVCGLLNAALLATALVHAQSSVLPTRPHQDRILKETHGYEALANYLAKKPAPHFADSYQITSMVRFYRPGLRIQQWPGITRPSELVRRRRWNPFTLEDLLAGGSFTLVTTNRRPPRIRGFHAAAMEQVRDCTGNSLQVIPHTRADQVKRRCKSPVHIWYLVTYESD